LTGKWFESKKEEIMRKLISLGQNSDVAFQLRMHGEENVPHFFDWLSTPADGVIKIIDEDFDVFYPDHLSLDTSSSPHHVVDRVTKAKFFHQFPLYNGNVLPNFLMFYDAFIGKFHHLAGRFRSYVRGGPVALVRRNISESEAVALEDVFFRRFPGADAKFIYVNEDRPHFITAHGASRSVRGEGSLGDPIAWWAALQDEGLIGPAFRHATAEILHYDPDDENLATVDRFTEVQLQTATAVNAEHGKFALELARFYIRKHRWDNAEEMARLALARSPGLPNAVFELNYINWKSKRIMPDEAASAFVLFLETESCDRTWLTETCAALLEAGRIEEATAYSGKAVMANPRDSEAHYNRALCLMKQRSFERAELSITTAINLRDHAYLHHIHATILVELGRWDDAVTAAKAACKIDGGVFYINNLASLPMRSAEALAPASAAMPAPTTVAAAQAVHERSIEKPLIELPVAAPPKDDNVPAAAQLPERSSEKAVDAAGDEADADNIDSTERAGEEIDDDEAAVSEEELIPFRLSVVSDHDPEEDDSEMPMRVIPPLRA
jgi:tetratricopeptide (TPR) repeat protein